MFFVLLVFYMVLVNQMNDSTDPSACNSKTGPSGLSSCVLLYPKYTKHQWATCLTDSYIKSKSNNRHHCEDRTRVFCWYQCMIEVHDDGGSGPVLDDCACNSTQDTPLSTLPPIPEWCYSPDGQQCNWYRECLEKRHPCEGTDNPYALTYAEKFCDLYTQHSSKFSTMGQKWINGVRKCLQVTLVPILRIWNSDITCVKIRDIAFASHHRCYTKPGFGAPSICDLGLMDWWAVFWTIKESFISTPILSLSGLINVAFECTKEIINYLLPEIAFVKLQIHYNHRIQTRSTPKQKTWNSEASQRLAGKIGDDIARSLNWEKKGVSWFTFHSNTSDIFEGNTFKISLLLASRKKFDMAAPTSPDVNLTNTVSILANTIEQGSLNIAVDHNPVIIESLAACATQECNSTYLDVKRMSIPATSGGCKMEQVLIIFATVIILHLLVYVLL